MDDRKYVSFVLPTTSRYLPRFFRLQRFAPCCLILNTDPAIAPGKGFWRHIDWFARMASPTADVVTRSVMRILTNSDLLFLRMRWQFLGAPRRWSNSSPRPVSPLILFLFYPLTKRKSVTNWGVGRYWIYCRSLCHPLIFSAFKSHVDVIRQHCRSGCNTGRGTVPAPHQFWLPEEEVVLTAAVLWEVQKDRRVVYKTVLWAVKLRGCGAVGSFSENDTASCLQDPSEQVCESRRRWVWIQPSAHSYSTVLLSFYRQGNINADEHWEFRIKLLTNMLGCQASENRPCNKALYGLCCSTGVTRVIRSRRIRWMGQVAPMGEKRNIYRILVGKPEGKTPPQKPRRTWEIILKWILNRTGLCGIDWLAGYKDKCRAVVETVMNFVFLKCGDYWGKYIIYIYYKDIIIY